MKAYREYEIGVLQYATIRNIAINTLANSTDPNLLLYRSCFLSIAEIQKLFHTIQRFILESKRFNNHLLYNL